MCAFAIVASARPRTSPAAIARSGEPNLTMSAATRPFSPSSAPVSTSTAPLGAATTAAIAAIPPATPNATATSLSTGMPTILAPSASDAIACNARPIRVRSSVQPAAAASASATAITKKERTWIDAPPTVTKPSCPTWRNGSGSGKT